MAGIQKRKMETQNGLIIIVKSQSFGEVREDLFPITTVSNVMVLSLFPQQ
jgi:hypothetical protein